MPNCPNDSPGSKLAACCELSGSGQGRVIPDGKSVAVGPWSHCRKDRLECDQFGTLLFWAKTTKGITIFIMPPHQMYYAIRPTKVEIRRRCTASLGSVQRHTSSRLTSRGSGPSAPVSYKHSWCHFGSYFKFHLHRTTKDWRPHSQTRLNNGIVKIQKTSRSSK
jgi:hypothetical protein